MTRFDLDKLLATAGATLAEEERAKLQDAMNAIIEKVTAEAEQAGRLAFNAQFEEIEMAKERNEQFEANARQFFTEVEVSQQNAVQKVVETGKAIASAINTDGQKVQTKLEQLKASRVMAELVWNDLPKKMVVGAAAFLGLLVGAVLTVLVAALEKREVDLQIAFVEREVTELRQFISYWRQTAGFEFGQYEGDRVVRLKLGQEFVRFVPPIGALTAGNLWKVRSR